MKSIKKLNRFNKKKYSKLFKKNLLRGQKEFFKFKLYKKQLLKSFCGNITDFKLKKMFKYFIKKKKKEEHIFNFFPFLESKIDILLVRIGLIKNIYEAQQAIAHKRVFVNNKRINTSFFFLKEGDFLRIKKKNKIFKNLPKNIQYNSFFKIFIQIRYLNIKEISYPFEIDFLLFSRYLLHNK
jgi:ribosomal protein S4